MTRDQKWKELSILVDKLNKTKTKIKIEYFDLLKFECDYREVDGNWHGAVPLNGCMHPKHFETSTGNTFCDMDECPILRKHIEEIE